MVSAIMSSPQPADATRKLVETVRSFASYQSSPVNELIERKLAPENIVKGAAGASAMFVSEAPAMLEGNYSRQGVPSVSQAIKELVSPLGGCLIAIGRQLTLCILVRGG